MEWNRTLSHDCSELLRLPQLSSWGSRTEHANLREITGTIVSELCLQNGGATKTTVS